MEEEKSVRIPVIYIVIALLAVGAVFAVKSKVNAIAAEAKQMEQKNQVNILESYQDHVRSMKDGPYALGRGWRYLQAKDYGRAVIVLEKAMELDKNSRDAAFYLGYAKLMQISNLKSQNDIRAGLNQAKDTLLAAQRLDPLFPTTNKLLGFTYEQLGNDKESTVWYARYKAVGGQ